MHCCGRKDVNLMVEAMVVSMGRLILAWVVVAALPIMAEATTYYTDKSGSNANSCATAATAASNRSLAKLTIGGTGGSGGGSCLTAAGDTLIVGDGTYVEGEISLTASGSSGSPITIQAEHLHLAILSSTSSNPSCAPNISFRASRLVIDGLRGQIDATDPAGCPNNSANGVFVRMWSTNDPAMGGNESTGHEGGVVRNCLVDYSSHRSLGIKSNQDNSLVENCVVSSSLEGFNGINQIYRNNTIDRADVWGEHLFCKGGARNCQFYNNTIEWSSGNGALTLGGNSSCCWWDASTHYECYNCVAYNNIIKVTGTSNWTVSFTGCKSCTMSNNVIVGTARLFMGPGGSVSTPPEPWPDLSVFENNIISGTGTACTTSWSSGTNTTTDYNDFYNCTSPPTQTHAISGDPLFVNPSSDWHLQSGSPGLEAGTTVTALTYAGSALDLSLDYTGAARQVQWDLGIYEDDTAAPAAGEPIMFISLAWLVFGIGVMAGSILVLNLVQVMSRKLPGMWRIVASCSARLKDRLLLRFAWRALTRDDSRPVRSLRNPIDAPHTEQMSDHADRHHQ